MSDNPDDSNPDLSGWHENLSGFVRLSLVCGFVIIGVLLSKVVKADVFAFTPSSNELTSSTVTFDWDSDVPNLRGYHVFVGQYAGQQNYYNSQQVGNPYVEPPITVSGLPQNDTTVVVRVYEVWQDYGWRVGGEFEFMTVPSPVVVEEPNVPDVPTDGETPGEGSGETVFVSTLELERQNDVTQEYLQLLLEMVIAGGACISLFMGWKMGMSR